MVDGLVEGVAGEDNVDEAAGAKDAAAAAAMAMVRCWENGAAAPALIRKQKTGGDGGHEGPPAANRPRAI